MEFIYGDVCLRYQYIVTVEDILSFRVGHAGWVPKVLQTKWEGNVNKGRYTVVTPTKAAYRDFCTYVMAFKQEIKRNSKQYTPEIITKVLLTYREILKVKYPEAFAQNSLGYYADYQVIKAYLRGELTSSTYNVQEVLLEQERIKEKVRLQLEKEDKIKKEHFFLEKQQEQLALEKYLSERIPLTVGTVFRRKRDIEKLYVGKNIAECVKFTKLSSVRWEITEVLVPVKVHPSILVG